MSAVQIAAIAVPILIGIIGLLLVADVFSTTTLVLQRFKRFGGENPNADSYDPIDRWVVRTWGITLIAASALGFAQVPNGATAGALASAFGGLMLVGVIAPFVLDFRSITLRPVAFRGLTRRSRLTIAKYVMACVLVGIGLLSAGAGEVAAGR